MKNSNFYLVKLAMDENDADYLYGVGVITKEQYEYIQKNLDLEIYVSSSTDAYRPVKECIDEIKPINFLEYTMLNRLGLSSFGEFGCFFDCIENALEAKEYKEEDEDENLVEECKTCQEVTCTNCPYGF